MNVAKTVVKIEANPLLSKHNNENALLRVAAYCRVSTDSGDQINSYNAQKAHYAEAIAKNPRWRFVDIYADEGITGTQDKKRKDFMRLIKDCNKGKVDLILTKSIARFARNTVDSLRYVRALKARGIGVYFEEQNIDSLKTDSEMFIGFHSVLAQAESENISANVRWGIQQRMKSGTFAFRYNILGYRKGEDGQPEIVQEEAETVRTLFDMYLTGSSIDQIKQYLEDNGIRTKKGSAKWSKCIIMSMLTNERYCGDMLCQKTYIENCLTKKVKVNNGEMTKYLILNNHPAIIDKDKFKLVQKEIARRGNKRAVSDSSFTGKGKYSGKYALTDLVICGECGSPYRRRTWTRKGITKRVWRCLSRVEHGTKYCKHSISIDEDKLMDAIRRAMQGIVDNREVYDLLLTGLSYINTGDNGIMDIYSMEQEIKRLNAESEMCVENMTRTGGDRERYMKEIAALQQKITVLREQLRSAREIMAENERTSDELARIRAELESSQPFGGDLNSDIRRMIEYIRVMPDGVISIVFKGGLSVEERV